MDIKEKEKLKKILKNVEEIETNMRKFERKLKK